MTEVLTVGKSSVVWDLCLLIAAAKLKTPGYIAFCGSFNKVTKIKKKKSNNSFRENIIYFN